MGHERGQKVKREKIIKREQKMHVHFMAQFLMERFTKSMKHCTPISLNIWNISRGSISTSRAGTSLRACSRVSGASSSSTTTTSSSPCSRSSQFRPRRGGQRTFYHFISPKSPSSCRYMCYRHVKFILY